MTRLVSIKNNQISCFTNNTQFKKKNWHTCVVLKMTLVLLKHGHFNKVTLTLMKHHYSKHFWNSSLVIVFITIVGATLEACFMAV